MYHKVIAAELGEKARVRGGGEKGGRKGGGEKGEREGGERRGRERLPERGIIKLLLLSSERKRG